MKLKLGALLGKKDPRNIRFGNYIRKKPDYSKIPELVDWDKGILRKYQMFGNDKAGDCVFAAAANLIVGASAKTGDKCRITTDDVLKHYSEVTGYNPRTGENDNGTYPEDALRYFSKLPESDPFHVLAWGEINYLDLDEVRFANYLFGGIYTALYLPKNSMTQFTNGQKWHYQRFPLSKSIAGGLGGHMTMTRLVDKNKDFATITWAQQQKLTQDWWKRYCSAAYFFITEKWIADNTGKTPSGFDLDALLEDVEVLKK